MKVFIERDGEWKSVKASTVKEMLEKLKLNPAAVLVAVNNELAAEDARLKPEDKVKVLSVISGG